MKQALLIMARQPVSGYTKTHLCPPLTHEEATHLYISFLHDTLDIARAVPNVTRFIAYTPVTAAAYFRKLAPDFEHIPQVGETVGQRLDSVLSNCLEHGYNHAVAISSDSPTLPTEYVSQAFTHLANDQTDVVLGPCDDGGYYLIGWKRPYPFLVHDIKISTANVFKDIVALAQKHNLHVATLPTWYDVDTLNDLRRLQHELTQNPSTAIHTRHLPRFAQTKLLGNAE